MRECLKSYTKRILSQVPIILVLLDLHFEGTEGLDKAEAQKHLARGNQLLNAGQLADALTHYHAAIDKDDKNYQAYYMRATVYLAMGKARSALPDLNQVVQLQPNFVQARLQRGNLFLKMGKFNEAQTDYEAVLAHEENEEAAVKVEEIRPLRRNINHSKKFMEANDYAHAIELLNEVIHSCPWNADFREMRSSAFEHLGDLRRAISDLKPTTILKLDNTGAFLKMSILWYHLGEVQQSLDEIRECLKLDPDHSECYTHYKHVKKLFKTLQAAKTKMEQKDWIEAISKFNKVLNQESRIVPLTIEIKLKICECYVKANDPTKAINSADEVLALEETNIPALLMRSEAHTQNQEYQEAVDDLQKASQIDDNYPGLADKIKKAQKLLKQSQKRDYYKILGVPRNAAKRDVIKAYRKLAREWHPDNFQDEEQKKVAEKKFIEIASAKEVLSDPDKLKILNDGFDPLDSEDVKEWEKEQALGRSGNLFEFFFQHNAAGGSEKTVHHAPFEDLFRSFTQHREQQRQQPKEEDPFAQHFRGKHAQQQQRKEEFVDSAQDHLRRHQHRFDSTQEQEQPRGEASQTDAGEHSQQSHHEGPQQQQQQQTRRDQREWQHTDSRHADSRQYMDGRNQWQQTDPRQQRQQQQKHSEPRQQHAYSRQQQEYRDPQQRHQTDAKQHWQHTDTKQKQQSDQRQQWQQQQRDARGEQRHASPKQQYTDPRKQQYTNTQNQQQRRTDHRQQNFESRQSDARSYQHAEHTRQEKTRQNIDPRQQHRNTGQQSHHYGSRQDSPESERRRSTRDDQSRRSDHERRRNEEMLRSKSKQTATKPTPKKKAKVKSQFKKKSTTAEEKEMAKRFTQGTDGKWYHKGSDGRWRLHDGPPQDTKKKKPQKAKPKPKSESAAEKSEKSQDSYADGKGNVYVKGNDGHWYMRIIPPSANKENENAKRPEPEQQSTRQETTRQQRQTEHEQSRQSYDRRHSKMHDDDGADGRYQDERRQDRTHERRQADPRSMTLPRGLFYNERKQISDRIGNIYERLPSGRFKLIIPSAQAKERLQDQLRSHKQADLLRQQREQVNAPPPPPPRPKQQIYHDASGNVFVKDANGNLIRIKPGQRGGPTMHQQRKPPPPPPPPPHATQEEESYSYQDPNVASGQKRWHRPTNEEEHQPVRPQPQQQFDQRHQRSQQQGRHYGRRPDFDGASQQNQFRKQHRPQSQHDSGQYYRPSHNQQKSYNKPSHEEL